MTSIGLISVIFKILNFGCPAPRNKGQGILYRRPKGREILKFFILSDDSRMIRNYTENRPLRKLFQNLDVYISVSFSHFLKTLSFEKYILLELIRIRRLGHIKDVNFLTS